MSKGEIIGGTLLVVFVVYTNVYWWGLIYVSGKEIRRNWKEGGHFLEGVRDSNQHGLFAQICAINSSKPLPFEIPHLLILILSGVYGYILYFSDHSISGLQHVYFALLIFLQIWLISIALINIAACVNQKLDKTHNRTEEVPSINFTQIGRVKEAGLVWGGVHGTAICTLFSYVDLFFNNKAMYEQLAVELAAPMILIILVFIAAYYFDKKSKHGGT